MNEVLGCRTDHLEQRLSLEEKGKGGHQVAFFYGGKRRICFFATIPRNYVCRRNSASRLGEASPEGWDRQEGVELGKRSPAENQQRRHCWRERSACGGQPWWPPGLVRRLLSAPWLPCLGEHCQERKRRIYPEVTHSEDVKRKVAQVLEIVEGTGTKRPIKVKTGLWKRQVTLPSTGTCTEPTERDGSSALLWYSVWGN